MGGLEVLKLLIVLVLHLSLLNSKIFLCLTASFEKLFDMLLVT
jgi:hypothetical protein